VVYDIQRLLDAQEIYKPADLEAFKQPASAPPRTLPNPTDLRLPIRSTKAYLRPRMAQPNLAEKVKALRKSAAEWETAFTKAKAAGNDAAAQSADIQRRTYDAQLKALLDFKGSLGASVVPMLTSPSWWTSETRSWRTCRFRQAPAEPSEGRSAG